MPTGMRSYTMSAEDNSGNSSEMSDIERFEQIITNRSTLLKPLEDYLDYTATFEDNFVEYQALNRKLSAKIAVKKVLSGRVSIKRPGPPVDLPKYSPPNERYMLAYRIFTKAYNTSGPLNPPMAPHKPKFPKIKTNTNLAQYIHKLYVYEQYLKTELKKLTMQTNFGSIDDALGLAGPSEKPSSSSGTTSSRDSKFAKTASGSVIALKHEFRPDTSITIARTLSRKSCRAVRL